MRIVSNIAMMMVSLIVLIIVLSMQLTGKMAQDYTAVRVSTLPIITFVLAKIIHWALDRKMKIKEEEELKKEK